MAKGFLYLVTIIDWASRAVLGWRIDKQASRTKKVFQFCGNARGLGGR
jgi:hypothetical protein